VGGTFWLGSARVCRRKVERSKISEYEAILGKGLGLEEVVFGEGSGLGEGSGPPQASCAADGLQTPSPEPSPKTTSSEPRPFPNIASYSLILLHSTFLLHTPADPNQKVPPTYFLQKRCK